MPVWRSAALFMLCASMGSAAVAQEKQPPEVVLMQKFGTDGTLSREGMRQYLMTEAYAPLDENEDGVIDLEEYRASSLYLRPDCSSGSIEDRFKEEKARATGPLTAASLFRANPAWRAHIEAMTAAHWKRAGATTDADTLDLAELRQYLSNEKKRHAPRMAVQRMAGLRDTATAAKTTTLDERVLQEFLYAERFRAVDQDDSGHIDLFEFLAEFPVPGAAQEFCAIAAADFLVDPVEFSAPNAAAPVLVRTLRNLSGEAWNEIAGFGNVDLFKRAQEFFEAQDKARLAAAKLRGISPLGFVPRRGYLIAGQRQVRQKKISYDADLTSVFVRVIKDFTFDDPLTAEPAVFSLTKEKGQDASVAMDATVQIDVRPANRTLRGVSAGVDVERNTAPSSLRHRQRYYATVDLFAFHGGSILEANSLRIAPFIENDDRKDVTRLAGDVIWEPGLHIGSFLTSAWRPLGQRAQWYVIPRVVLELSKPLGDAPDEEDATHARLELLWGLEVQRFSATLKNVQRRGIGSDLGHSHFEELSAWWNVDELKRFSLRSSFAWGKELPSDAAQVRTFTAGIGLRF